MTDLKKPEQPDAKIIDEKLKAMGTQGETPEERLITFKKEFWTDSKLGGGYLKPLADELKGDDKEALLKLAQKAAGNKPPFLELDKLSEKEAGLVLKAINERREEEGKHQALTDKAVIEDKKTHWTDATLTASVAKKIDEVEKIIGQAVEVIGDVDLINKPRESRLLIKNAADLNRDGEISNVEIDAIRKAAGANIDQEASDYLGGLRRPELPARDSSKSSKSNAI